MNVDKILEEIRYVTEYKIKLPIELVDENDIKWYIKGWKDAMYNIPLSITKYKFDWHSYWQSYKWGYENYHSQSIRVNKYFDLISK